MKLFNQFNILPRYLTAFNYAGLNLNETPKELEKCTPEFQNFWEKECREHPTNQNCLIYCDWVIIFKVFIQYTFLKKRFPSGFTQENVCYYGFKHVGITKFMTVLFLGTIEWEWRIGYKPSYRLKKLVSLRFPSEFLYPICNGS